MTCHDHETVRSALEGGLCHVTVGPYTVEYINDAGPYFDVESEHLAMIERNSGSVRDLIDIDGEAFKTMVEYYGAEGF